MPCRAVPCCDRLQLKYHPLSGLSLHISAAIQLGREATKLRRRPPPRAGPAPGPATPARAAPRGFYSAVAAEAAPMATTESDARFLISSPGWLGIPSGILQTSAWGSTNQELLTAGAVFGGFGQGPID